MTQPGPIIYQNQPTPIIAPRFSWPFFVFRILSLALVLLILFMIFQAVMLFLSRSTNLNLKFGQLPAKFDRTPSITLSPAKLLLKTGQTSTLTIDYFTGNKTIQGIDVVVKYDPAVLEFGNDFFKIGPIFTQYPITQVFPPGTLHVSAVATVAQIGFNGSGQLGSLQFRALKPGQTKVEIVFEPNKTTESNLVELGSGQEILQTVRSTTIEIQ